MGLGLDELTGAFEKVAKLPICTWSYVVEPSTTRHLGPMAQDFHQAFGLGTSDKRITPIDANGVAIAAIQALYDMLQEKERRIAELEARLDTLQRDGEEEPRGE